MPSFLTHTYNTPIYHLPNIGRVIVCMLVIDYSQRTVRLVQASEQYVPHKWGFVHKNRHDIFMSVNALKWIIGVVSQAHIFCVCKTPMHCTYQGQSLYAFALKFTLCRNLWQGFQQFQSYKHIAADTSVIIINPFALYLGLREFKAQFFNFLLCEIIII